MEKTLSFQDLEVEIQKQGPNLFFRETVEFDMEHLPAGIKSITVKGFFLGSKLLSLPENIFIHSHHSLELDGLTHISHVTIITRHDISLNALTTIGDTVTLIAAYIDMDNLIAIGNHVVISSDSTEYDNLTTIGSNVSIKDFETVNMKNVTTIGSNVHLYADQSIRFEESLSHSRDFSHVLESVK